VTIESGSASIFNLQSSVFNKRVMAEKVLMLALSPTMETGTIAKWSKQEGETVASGDVICEVETDKAVMDYESMQEGTLLKIVLPEGGAAEVGDTIAIIGEEGEDIAALLEERLPKPPKQSQEKPKETPATEEAPQTAQQESAAAPPSASTDKIKASPLAKAMANDAGLELSAITGSGPGGRIIKRDIEQAMQQPARAQAPVQMIASAEDETIPVSQKRKIIAQRLAESKYSAPHYYLKVRVNMDTLLQARKTLNARSAQKVSMNAFLIKFVAEALRRHPMVNSTWQAETILKHGHIDIGLAVAQPDGLITPVVRDCAVKGILAIDEDLQDLIQKAQNNRLQPDEYTNATFTISNLGSFGIQEFTAIINPPGSAILAVGEIRREPVVGEEDELFIHSLMTLTLSCDHRVIDGVIGAAFLKTLKDMLEDPIRTLY
jgi:pyruvate dehydrogenase E2 component (dihydrolipoamide acetyltransferase)